VSVLCLLSGSRAGVDHLFLDSVIFELIKGEMAYVKDLENIEYVRPKRIIQLPC